MTNQEAKNRLRWASVHLGLKFSDLIIIDKCVDKIYDTGFIDTTDLRVNIGGLFPGSFSIMKDSLDVRIEELDRMLKNEEVKWYDLAKFIKTMEKTYQIPADKNQHNKP